MSSKARTLWCLVVLFMLTGTTLFAFGSEQHDEYMLQVLFGKQPTVSRDNPAVKALSYASYLTLDQFNGNGATELNFLLQKKVKKIPKQISKIDFSGNAQHRSYTHRGWDFSYPLDKANWNVRKKILLATADKLFVFKNDQQCNSFCALIYYVHVLGDHIADSSIKKSDLKIEVAGRADDHDIVNELTKHLQVLFKYQSSSRLLTTLLQNMRALDRTVTTLMRIPGGFASFTEEDVLMYKNSATELMDLLITYVPELLQQEEFFTDVFLRAKNGIAFFQV